MEQQTVVITGCLGQFGSYATDLYLEKGYKVIGIHRRSSLLNLSNVKQNIRNENFILYEGDICDTSSLSDIITKFKPNLWLNAAAQSHVHTSYNQPIYTAEVNYIGVAKTLEAIRLLKPDIRFWQASTSERYGDISNIQDTKTLPGPISPYSVSKVASEFLIKSYRSTYNMYATYSIMFNYESERRSPAFVTRKISSYIGNSFNKVEKNVELLVKQNKFIDTQKAFENAISLGIIDNLYLGNIYSKRSWTHCKDMVQGVYDQMNLAKPTDLIFGLEETHSVEEFLNEAFNNIGIKDWSNIVKFDQKLLRPSDVQCLHPICLDAKTVVNWTPKYTFKELVKEMVESDIKNNN